MAPQPNAPSRSAPLLDRWARFSYRHKWKIIAVWVVILASLTLLNMNGGGTLVSEFRVPGSEAQEAHDLLETSFPARSGDTSDLVFEAPGGISDPAIQSRIQKLIDDIIAVKMGVLLVESPYDQPNFISKDGTIARAVVHWKDRSSKISSANLDEYLKIVDASGGGGLTVETGGNVIAQREHVAFGSEYIGLAVAVLILLIAFGSVIAMGLPLAAAVFGLGAGFASIGLAANVGKFPEFSPQFGAMIGLGVGIDYSLLIVTRFREGLHSGHSVEDSLALALNTSGRAVIFAGMVVAVAFLGLFMMGLPFVAALGTAGAIVVTLAVLVALTLIPAVLSLAGHNIDRWRLPFLHSTEGVDPKSMWYRLSEAIQRRPIVYFLGAVVLLLALAAPALDMTLGFNDAGNGPTTSHSRRAYDLLSKGFGPGFNGSLIVVADTSGGGADRLDGLLAAIQSADDVEQVSPPVKSPDGNTTLITVIPRSSPQADATKTLVHTMRQEIVPSAISGSAARVYVGGGLASNIDAGDRIASRMPLLFTGVIGLSFLLLTLVFRSVVVAAKAAVMNLLSIGASYGVLVAVFQWGWLSNVTGVDKGPVETFLPMMMFAILFGLSMDYEVFLISRVREEYLRTRDNASSVSHGLAATARVITAAAAIMVAVFLTFVLGDERVIKEFGIGLATAIFVDATIVRLLLVPSTMELLGDRNWWLPGWLDRAMPHISVDGPVEAPLSSTGSAVGK